MTKSNHTITILENKINDINAVLKGVSACGKSENNPNKKLMESQDELSYFLNDNIVINKHAWDFLWKAVKANTWKDYNKNVKLATDLYRHLIECAQRDIAKLTVDASAEKPALKDDEPHVDLADIKAKCYALIKNAGTTGNVAGIKAGYAVLKHVITSGKEMDQDFRFRRFNEVCWEQLLRREGAIRQQLNSIKSELAGLNEVKTIFKLAREEMEVSNG